MLRAHVGATCQSLSHRCTYGGSGGALPAQRHRACSSAWGSARSCDSKRKQVYNSYSRSCAAAARAAPAATRHAAAETAAAANSCGTLPRLLASARVTDAAKAAWWGVVAAGDTVVDATCGNGHDTLELARLVGPSGCVVALDIQADAVESTRRRLQQELPPEATPDVQLHNTCHSHMQAVLGERQGPQPTLVCFNLGWLPSGDKQKTTATATTLAALQQAQALLSVGGLVSVVAYTAHPGGMEEYSAVRDFMAELDSSAWVCTESRLLNREGCPRLLLAYRLPGRGSMTWRPQLALVPPDARA